MDSSIAIAVDAAARTKQIDAAASFLGLAALVLAGCAHHTTPSRDPEPGFGDSFGDSVESVAKPEIPETIPPRDCNPQTTEVAPSDGRIAGKARVETYLVDGAVIPIVVLTDGTLHATVHFPRDGASRVAGLIMRFHKCMDASAWKGVSFAIRGSFWGCSIRYATSDVQHEDRNLGAPFATGRHGSSPPETELGLSWATRDAQTVRVPFEDEEAISHANPPLPLDRSKLTSMVWKLSSSSSGTCAADLFIGNLSFY